jgi:putative aldouronate transport system permease protein
MGKIIAHVRKDKYLLLLMIPGLAYYVVFRYLPMFGVAIAFEDFSYRKGVFGSAFVGLKHFISFASGPNFFPLLRNTAVVGILNILITLPVSILFAILLSELWNKKFSGFVQAISLMPYFISTVVIVGITFMLISPDTGIVNRIVKSVTGNPIIFMAEPRWFRPLYVITEIWQKNGWQAVVFTAAIVGIDQNLYEASAIDGAGRIRNVFHITLPSIFPVIAVMLVLRTGSIMSLSFEKALLLQNPLTYSTSDIIDTYTYRRGLLDGSVSFATSVELFKGVISLFLVYVTNTVTRKLTNRGIW